jgi:hypothetical protein
VTSLEQSLDHVDHNIWLWESCQRRFKLSPERAEQLAAWKVKREQLLIEVAAEKAEINRVMAEFKVFPNPVKREPVPEVAVVFMPRTTDDAWRDERSWGWRNGAQLMKRENKSE